MRIKKDVVLTDGDDDHTDDNITLRKYYYTGSAVLFVADSSNNKLLENILMPNGTTLMSARYEQEEEGNPINGYYTFNTDIRGSITNILNHGGTLTTGYVYDEYGNQIKTGEQDFLNEATYTGAIYDDESELYYMNSRYYSSTTGQFTTRDTYLGNISNPSTHNLYTYTGNNPVNFVDPTGHNPAGIGAIIGGIIGAVYSHNHTGKVTFKPVAIGAVVGALSGAVIGAAITALVQATVEVTAIATTGMVISNAIKNMFSNNSLIQNELNTIVNKIPANIVENVKSSISNTVAEITTSIHNEQVINNKIVINNIILDKPIVGSALKLDKYHAFCDIVDNYAGLATKFDLGNASLYQIEGSFNGVGGRFEWIEQDGNITHRLFVPAGTINGKPSKK